MKNLHQVQYIITECCFPLKSGSRQTTTCLQHLLNVLVSTVREEKKVLALKRKKNCVIISFLKIKKKSPKLLASLTSLWGKCQCKEIHYTHLSATTEK